MNKKLGLAVAGAVLALGASTSALAGITIPAGDWTVDIGGNVNAFYTNKSVDYSFKHDHGGGDVWSDSWSPSNGNSIGTGLLPAALGISAKTRQNDLDIAFQFSFFTGTSSNDNGALSGGSLGSGSNSLNIRQAFVSFGDASWGTIKAGRDLGVFGSDAILSDMTLLGVGVSATGSNQSAGGSSTLGRIGSGYMYANWYGQMQYASPSWNGFQFTGAVQEGTSQHNTNGKDLGFAGKATYDFAANDVTGRVWVGGFRQKQSEMDNTIKAWELGAKASYAGATLVGYYYNGDNIDSQWGAVDYDYRKGSDTIPGYGGSGVGGIIGADGTKTQDSGGYVQLTYVVPGIGTKLGASWGISVSNLDTDYASNGAHGNKIENESWIVGAYHPLTKSLNLVAEYTRQEITNTNVSNGSGANNEGKAESDTVSLGAILFF